MNTLVTQPQTPDDTRVWSPSVVQGVGSGIPRHDPLALLLAEQKRERTTLRLVLSAAAALLILLIGAGVFG